MTLPAVNDRQCLQFAMSCRSHPDAHVQPESVTTKRLMPSEVVVCGSRCCITHGKVLNQLHIRPGPEGKPSWLQISV
jgi:hypothetical protein